MITVDNFTVSSEMVEFLKTWSPKYEHDCTILSCYTNDVSRIQDFLCRHLSELPKDCIPEISEYLNSLVTMKDDFNKLEKLLPIIKEVA